jgi:hypothetical protein
MLLYHHKLGNFKKSLLGHTHHVIHLCVGHLVWMIGQDDDEVRNTKGQTENL